MSKTYSTALSVAELVLRMLIVANWAYGLAVVALLAATFIDAAWVLGALGIAFGSEVTRMLPGVQVIACLGLVTIPLHYVVLSRLLGFVRSVRDDPFVPDNTRRLTAIARSLLGLQVLSLMIAGVGKLIEAADRPLELDAGFSTTGWLAVLLAFVLAGVFAQGTRMRADLDGTV